MEPLELESILEHAGGQWVSTTPVPRLRVAEIGTDTRTLARQSVFVALPGSHCDGHAFVAEAKRRGAVASIVRQASLASLPPGGGPYIAVAEPLDALEQLAIWHRGRLRAQVVAVTGSVGKTSTKEFLTTVLAGAFQVRSAPKSFNNRLGVALTLLSAARETEVLVMELGTSAPGEIAHLSRVAKPHKIVITEIAPAHLDGLKDIDGVVAAKAEIFDGWMPEGSAFVRAGVRGYEVFAARAACGARLVTFGWGKGMYAVTDCQRVLLGHDPSDCGAVSPEYGYHFTLNRSENFLLPVPGRHNVLNAAAAAAVARDFGMRWDQIRSQLADCRLPPLRLQVTDEHGLVLVDDTYNANPASMEAAISEWESLEAGEGQASRVAVLGDMLEMGAHSRMLHSELGKRLSLSGARLVITVGGDSRFIGEACDAQGGAPIAHHFESAANAVDFLKANLRAGDCVLFKGSRRIGLDRAVQAVRIWARERFGAARLAEGS